MLWYNLPKGKTKKGGCKLKRLGCLFLLTVLWLAITSQVLGNPLPKNIQGKGMIIWQITKVEGGNVQKIIKKAKDMGLSYFAVKTHDGDLWCDNLDKRLNGHGRPCKPYNSRKTIKRLVRTAHKQGIHVLAWGYDYGKKISFRTVHYKKVWVGTEESTLAIRSMNQLGCDGYFFDVESEFNRQRNKYAIKQAIKLCKPVRTWRDKNAKSKVLAYTTFCRLGHQPLPYEQFDQYCDTASPQAYWQTFRQDPKHTVCNMCVDWGSMQDRWHHDAKPIIPMGQCYRNTNPNDIQKFIDCAKGYGGQIFWAWDYAGKAQTDVIKFGPSPKGVTKVWKWKHATVHKPKHQVHHPGHRHKAKVHKHSLTQEKQANPGIIYRMIHFIVYWSLVIWLLGIVICSGLIWFDHSPRDDAGVRIHDLKKNFDRVLMWPIIIYRLIRSKH